MPKSVRRKSNISDTQLLPEYLEIPFKVPNGDGRVILSSKDIGGGNKLRVAFRFKREMEEMFTKFAGEGYDSMFSALSPYREDQILYVEIFFRQSKNLARSKPRIQNRKRHKMGTLEIYRAAHEARVAIGNAVADELLNGNRGKHR